MIIAFAIGCLTGATVASVGWLIWMYRSMEGS